MLDNVHVELFWAALVGAVASMTGAAVVTAIIIGALYFGRELFVPIALRDPAEFRTRAPYWRVTALARPAGTVGFHCSSARLPEHLRNWRGNCRAAN